MASFAVVLASPQQGIWHWEFDGHDLTETSLAAGTHMFTAGPYEQGRAARYVPQFLAADSAEGWRALVGGSLAGADPTDLLVDRPHEGSTFATVFAQVMQVQAGRLSLTHSRFRRRLRGIRARSSTGSALQPTCALRDSRDPGFDSSSSLGLRRRSPPLPARPRGPSATACSGSQERVRRALGGRGRGYGALMRADYERVVALLREHGAEGIPHPGGTLLVHLQRVEQRLRDHGADEVSRLAALAHAVYGTDGFDTHLLALSERHVLTEAANDEVERLVYLYAACDRSKTWRRLAETREVHDRWTGEVVSPSPAVLARFVDLSIVNELDVVEHSAEARAKFAAPLLHIYRSWQGLGSAAVSNDAERVLAPAA